MIIILGAAFHLVQERIDARILPSGDEGSWMSVAAQLARGEGFTTRWLEHPFLTHASLPRPDDFRYPVFTLLLAGSFKIFGISYTTGLWTVGACHLLLLLIVYLVSRKIFGSTTAIISMAVTSVSLLQLYWNTAVYVEALSGCCIGAIVWWIYKTNVKRIRDAMMLGVLLGVFYLIRPNGILLATGVIFLYGWNPRTTFRQWRIPLIVLAVMLAVMLPWLIRTAYYFGNPFHVATGAGLLRADENDPLTLTTTTFFLKYGIGQIVKTLIPGIPRLFTALHFFEHSLEIVPLAGFVLSIVVFRKKHPAFLICGFVITLIACCYVAYNYSWAGVRYLSSFLPWMYVFGIDFWNRQLRLLTKTNKLASYAASACLIPLLLAPVYYPHRFYERHFAQPVAKRVDIIDEHLKILSAHLPPQGVYCAHTMAQLNFMTTYRCAGMHEFFDSTHVSRMLHEFTPTLLIMTINELNDPRIQAIMRTITAEGYALKQAVRTSTAVYYKLAPR